MSRELLIMRHAKSDWSSGAATDFDRPLNMRGSRDAPKMGGWLKAQGLVPDYIIASPAQRAKETVLAVCAELEVDEEAIHWESRIYEAALNTLLQLLEQIPDSASCILMVGHNPGLEAVVHVLSGSSVPLSATGKGFTTANIAWLKIPESGSALDMGCGQLEQLVRPSEL